MAKFTIETRKQTAGYQWSNTWHVEAPNLLEAGLAAVSIGNFEAALLDDSCIVDYAKVSAWPNPTHQQWLRQELDIPGERDLANLEPATMCLLALLPVGIGFPGKKWLRLSLDESEVTTVAGEATLNGSAPVRGIFATAATVLADELDATSVSLLVGSTPATSRPTSFAPVLNGVGFRDMDVGWYNREE